MDAYWWGPHLFAWTWILPLSFIVVCLFFLFAYLLRGPRWFYGRSDRRELSEAVRGILDRRYAMRAAKLPGSNTKR